MNDQAEKLKIHFFYCVLLLGLAIILVATDRWTAQKDFTTYLSNAATMTSLVLGLVAIFYSFIANDGLSKSLGNISTVADEVGKSRDQISLFVTHTTAATEAAERNTAAVERVTQEVTTSIFGLHSTLESIRTQSQSLQTTLQAIPTRLDQLETNVVDATKAAAKANVAKEEAHPTSGTGSDVSDEIVDTFLAKSALFYNLFTYALVVAYRTRKSLSVAKLGEIVGFESPMAFVGFLSCMSSVNIVEVDYLPDSSSYNVKKIHKRLETNTRSYIESYLKRATTISDDEKEQRRGQLRSIDALLA